MVYATYSLTTWVLAHYVVVVAVASRNDTTIITKVTTNVGVAISMDHGDL